MMKMELVFSCKQLCNCLHLCSGLKQIVVQAVLSARHRVRCQAGHMHLIAVEILCSSWSESEDDGNQQTQ